MDYKTRYNDWINDSTLLEADKQELLGLDEKERQDRFYTKLKFGTGGMRGVVGIGEN
jgi:phosphomannomutase